MVENRYGQAGGTTTSTGFLFEAAVEEMFRRVPGIDVSRTMKSHDDGVDMFITDGTPIGISGPLNVQVAFRRSAVGGETVEKILSFLRNDEKHEKFLLITNKIFTRQAKKIASDRIILWGAKDLREFTQRFPASAAPIRSFLMHDGGDVFDPTLYRPTVSVVRTDKGWNLNADAFVLPLGIGGVLSGSTYRALVNDQDDQAEFNRVLATHVPLGFGPYTPVVLPRQTGSSRNLILATAYDGKLGVVPGEALKSILSLNTGFRRIVLPLLGAAQLELNQVLNEFHSVISSAQLVVPLHILLVVIEQDAERLAKQRFVGYEDLSSTLTPPSQPHFTNDAVNGHTTKDCLGIEAEARTFAQLLASRNVTLPLAIGLFGNWGSGKSFFMNLIHQQMDIISSEERAKLSNLYCANVAHITFNAWHYLDSDL